MRKGRRLRRGRSSDQQQRKMATEKLATDVRKGSIACLSYCATVNYHRADGPSDNLPVRWSFIDLLTRAGLVSGRWTKACAFDSYPAALL